MKTVSVEVKKTQHKYIIGPRGVNLGDILAETGVSVEVPILESPSETITLRGDADKLGIALTLVYSKVILSPLHNNNNNTVAFALTLICLLYINNLVR